MVSKKDIIGVTLFIGILVAGGLLLSDMSERNDALSAGNRGVDITYSIADAYGFDQSWTLIVVFLLSIGTAVFFLVVYPLLVRRPIGTRT